MDFCVVRSRGGLVQPSGLTPSGTLDLSVIDRLAVLRCNARTLHVFRHGAGAAHVIREALSKALVNYYPLAGRLNVSSQSGQLQIACSGEGVWFVEASANCSLGSVNYFDVDAASIPYDMLLPHHTTQTTDQGTDDALVLMQVTQFACDGFVIGLVFCHSICDGLGAAQFLNAVGELARGLPDPTIAPAWCRDFLPPQQPPPTETTPPPPLPLPDYYRLEPAIIDITTDQIKQLKQEFQDSTGGQTCSSFEIVAATLWIHRTRAILHHFMDAQANADDKDPSTHQFLKLVFFANCRQLIFNPPLPQGFYGNCFFPVTVSASSQTLTGSSSIVHVVKLIQEAKTRLPDEFAKWTKGEQLNTKDGQPVDPFTPPLLYTTLFISEWGRLGFNQIDYGWGPPVHVVPIQGSSIIPVAIVGSLPWPNKGVRLMTWCVQKPHLQPFFHHMHAQFQLTYA